MKLLGPRLPNHLSLRIETEPRDPVGEGRGELIDRVGGYAVVGTGAQRIQHDVMDLNPIRIVSGVDAHPRVDQPFGLPHLMGLAVLARWDGARYRSEGSHGGVTFRGLGLCRVAFLFIRKGPGQTDRSNSLVYASSVR